MVAFTFYPFIPKDHECMLSNWIEGWLSQKADQDKAAKRNVPYLTVVDQDGDPAGKQ